MHVVLDGHARDFLGCREQRSDVDIETEIGERRRDHLLAAVVAVLAHLGDEDAGTAAFVALELGAHRDHAARILAHSTDLRSVDALDRADLRLVAPEHGFQRVGYFPHCRLRARCLHREVEQVGVAACAVREGR